MEYVPFGKTGLMVSRFGLGCMRFPEKEQDAIAMVRYAIDHGVNYLDTAYVYKNSEVITGKALRDGYREKILLATKSPLWNINKHADFEKYLDEQLKRLGTDYIDIYLLHNLNHLNWEVVKKYDGFTFLDKMVQKGKIRHRACSVHNTFEAFEEISAAYDWEMAQIQLNILDEHQQVGIEGMRLAAAKGMAVVIMEPLRGGHLVNQTPQEVKDLIAAYPDRRSMAEWCFRWLYNMPEVSLILSGTSSLEQLKENLRIFAAAAPNVMTAEETELIRKVQEIYRGKNAIGCTGCNYCMPCPQGLDIPEIFRLYNGYHLTKAQIDKIVYQHSMIPVGKGADQCVACGHCTEHCPQSLDVPALFEKVHEDLMVKIRQN